MYLKSRQSPDGQWAYPGCRYAAADLLGLYRADGAFHARAAALRAQGGQGRRTIRRFNWPRRGWRKRSRRTTTIELDGCSGWHGPARTKMRRRRPCGSCWRRSGPMAAGPISTPWRAAPIATGRALLRCRPRGCRHPMRPISARVQFLLKTQQEDGSWYVRTRAMAFQPYFDAGFPHGFDQWISAAGQLGDDGAVAGLPGFAG